MSKAAQIFSFEWRSRLPTGLPRLVASSNPVFDAWGVTDGAVGHSTDYSAGSLCSVATRWQCESEREWSSVCRWTPRLISDQAGVYSKSSNPEQDRQYRKWKDFLWRSRLPTYFNHGRFCRCEVQNLKFGCSITCFSVQCFNAFGKIVTELLPNTPPVFHSEFLVPSVQPSFPSTTSRTLKRWHFNDQASSGLFQPETS